MAVCGDAAALPSSGSPAAGAGGRLADLRFFGLLHIAANAGAPINLKTAGDPVDIYVRCAAVCAMSFARLGYSWTLVTNEPARIKARLAALGLNELEVMSHQFVWQIPKGIPFYSAHYKLELFEAFGKGLFGDRVCLVDIDTVLLDDFSAGVLGAPGLVGYDITSDEIRDYGEGSIRSAIGITADTLLPPRWYGGEFLLGNAADFASLSHYVAKLWPRYVADWRTLHHQGDEVLISAAIALMQRDGMAVADAGSIGDVHRWWSARTLSPREPLIEALKTRLLHLPSDKDFLASRAIKGGFDPVGFVAAYRHVATRKAWSRRLVDLVQRVRRVKPRRYAPRIG